MRYGRKHGDTDAARTTLSARVLFNAESGSSLMCSGSGSGGVDELTEKLVHKELQYALLRVKSQQSETPANEKFVLLT